MRLQRRFPVIDGREQPSFAAKKDIRQSLTRRGFQVTVRVPTLASGIRILNQFLHRQWSTGPIGNGDWLQINIRSQSFSLSSARSIWRFGKEDAVVFYARWLVSRGELKVEERSRRPAIPQSVQCELWARAAGRCEFRGCNELLYKDNLTQERSNLAVISHIVAFSPSGPRGDAIRSKLLEKDIRNLMLTCRKHGKLIDDKAQETVYPEELLLAFKREHELRVRLVTAFAEDAQTHVLILQAPVDGHDIVINPADAHRAIQPKYPADEHPTVIDLSGTRLPAEGEAFFSLMAQSITQQIQELLNRRSRAFQTYSLSVFAIAPIPLLIHAGRCLGGLQRIELYQHHRDTQNWKWKDEEDAQVLYEIVKPKDSVDSDQPIALLFSISGRVSYDLVAQTLGKMPTIYEIRALEIGRGFLKSRKRLELFSYEVQNILVALQDAHYQRKVIHVFAAIPAPLAIEFGRNIKSLDTPFIIYEYENSQHAYVPALRINAV